MHFSHYKALLGLSDEAMELADRYQLDEKKLRYVVKLAPEFHSEVVRQIIDLNLTSKQVKDLCEGGDLEDQEDDSNHQMPVSARKLAKAVRASTQIQAAHFAQALLEQEQNIGMARARLQGLHQLLIEAEKYLIEER